MSTISGVNSALLAFQYSPSASQSSTLEIPTPAPWLGDVQRRLSNSVNVPNASDANRRWLTGDVVAAANTFFLATSDLFSATAPYLDSSAQGDLVAEFKFGGTDMTMIFTNAFATALATIGGHPVQRRIALTAAKIETLRAELSRLKADMTREQNGKVDT